MDEKDKFDEWFENRYKDNILRDFIDTWIYTPCKEAWKAAIKERDGV